MRIAARLSVASLFLVTLLDLLRIAPPPYRITELSDINVDLAFILTLPYLLKEGVQYGPGAVFTYGPWGMLSTGYATSEYMPLVWLFNITWTLCNFGIFWFYIERPQPPLARIIAWAGCALLPLLWITGHKEAYFLLPVLFLLFHRITDNKAALRFSGPGLRASSLALVLALAINILLGWAALAKFNIFIIATAANLLILPSDLLRKRIPVMSITFAASLLTAWAAAGQRFANLPIWIGASVDLSRGYSDAMAKGFLSPYAFDIVVAFYLSVALVLAAAFLAYACRPNDPPGMFLFLFIAIASVAAIQHAMGGNQIEQSVGELFTISWVVLLHPALPLVAASRETHARAFVSATAAKRLPVVVGAILLGAVACISFVGAHVNFPIVPLRGAIQGDLLRNVSSLANPSTILQNHDQAWAALLSAAHDLAPLGQWPRGTTLDIYPQHTPIAIAREGMVYTPRPAYLSLNAHTMRLATVNAEHLRSTAAPAIVLFQVLRPDQSVNNRLPALADGLSWPILLSRYQVVGVAGQFLVLRRGRAVEPQLQLLDERELHLGKRLRLPAAGTGLLWAQIEVRPALLGKLVHSIYKSPHVLITIRTADRVERTYQLVPALAKAGFLLSPLVGDTGAFAAISRRATPENDVVRSITITSPDAPVGFWQQYITIRLYELSIPPPQ